MKQNSKQYRNNRGNKNRNRGGGGGGGSGGHSANRVYDSSGPEGKVRGTAAQIIDKYSSLARDAMLAGDRITAENFYQHAEHYQRILSAVQQAEAEDRERRAAQQAERDAQRDRERQDSGADAQPSGPEGVEAANGAAQEPQEKDGGSALIETPEARKAEERSSEANGHDAGATAEPPKRARRSRRKPSADEAVATSEGDSSPAEA